MESMLLDRVGELGVIFIFFFFTFCTVLLVWRASDLE